MSKTKGSGISFTARISKKALENIHSKGDWDKAKEDIGKEIARLSLDRKVSFTLSISLEKLKGMYAVSQSWSFQQPKGENWDVPDEIMERANSIVDKYLDLHNIQSAYVESKEYKELMEASDKAQAALKRKFGKL